MSETNTITNPDKHALWKDFSLWWEPRHLGNEPRKDDPNAWECYQFYCAGRLDEKTVGEPK